MRKWDKILISLKVGKEVELSQHRGHENKGKNKENFQSKNFKEDVPENF
jgi:hypothetical protein